MTTLRRFEVRTKPHHQDPRAAAALARARAAGFSLDRAATAKVYLIEAPLTPQQADRVLTSLLVDPVVEVGNPGALPAPAGLASVEVHPLPGVMDPAAQTVSEAIRELTGIHAAVSTAVRYDLGAATPLTPDDAAAIARTALANPVIHEITPGGHTPASLPKGREYQFRPITVALRDLTDEQLMTLSRTGHLFLNLDEMRAIQAHYKDLRRDPTDIELETLAQTWSEHCVHKTLKATIRLTTTQASAPGAASPAWHGPTPAALAARLPGHTQNPDGSVTIRNLLKSTVAAATFELIKQGVDWTLSVFKDNSGVIAFDDQFAVNIKVETHNRPSAIEPYGGAATGIGGCIRDVIATGLGARPIASTDVFCVANPTRWQEGGEKLKAAKQQIAKPTSADNAEAHNAAPLSFAALSSEFSLSLPEGVLPPRRVLTDVVAGVRDYGNRMGIPTVAGGVFFDDRYVGNPLVFCGCIGLIPRHLVTGKARAGDRIIALGGRTGRDGIHGATFSSAELQSTASTEFAHAVQIGNAIEEKRLLDAILRAQTAGPADAQGRGTPLYTAMTDCGAGGFSSAVGEMGSTLGARVTLDTAPLKYAGLSYTEIWISEAQERIVLAVPQENVPALRTICEQEGVLLADLGEFGTDTHELILTFQGHEVGRMSMHFLHEGLPNPTREATWNPAVAASPIPTFAPLRGASSTTPTIAASLLALLAHPTIASKHWIIRQYDHEVQGNSVIKPFAGPLCRGPSDAAVIEPVPNQGKGLAITQGLHSKLGDPALGGDPYQMALSSIDECVRNLVCSGADPTRIAILDNFCWASCDKPENLARLVRAAQGCYDGALAYRTPFVSGKDSLSNQLRTTDPITGRPLTIEVPPTLLITGMGIVQSLTHATTTDAKRPGNRILLVCPRAFAPAADAPLGASLFQELAGLAPTLPMPVPDLKAGPAAAACVASLIQQGAIASAHDASEGGLLVALAEMLIAGSSPAAPIGATLAASLPATAAAAFAETPSRYLLEVTPDNAPAVTAAAAAMGLACVDVATLTPSGRLTWPAAALDEAVETLAKTWMGTLDW